MKKINCIDGFVQVFACTDGSIEPAPGYRPDKDDGLCDWSEWGYIPQRPDELPETFTTDEHGALARVHGGRREGAGRKHAPELLETISVTIFARQIKRLAKLNPDNVSDALRKLIDQTK